MCTHPLNTVCHAHHNYSNDRHHNKCWEFYIILFIYLFTVAADRPSLSARAGWKREEKEIDYRIQLEHGLLKWKVCALFELKVVMKWSFRNWTILIFDNGGLGEINEVTSEWIPQSNYMIKVKVRRALRWRVEVRRVRLKTIAQLPVYTCHINNGRQTTAVTFSISVKYLNTFACNQAQASVPKLTTLFKIYNGFMPDALVYVRLLYYTKNFRNSQQLFLRPAACTSSVFASSIASWNWLPQAVHQESNSLSNYQQSLLNLNNIGYLLC